VQNCRSGAWVILAIAIFLVNIFLFYVIPVSPHLSSIPKPTDNKLADQFYQTAVDLDSAGKTAEAGAAAAQAIAMNPNLAGAQLLMGRILYKQNRYTEARDAFKKATLAAPLHPGGFEGLGLSLRAINKPWDSVRAFQQAIHLDPGNASYHYDQGLSYVAGR